MRSKVAGESGFDVNMLGAGCPCGSAKTINQNTDLCCYPAPTQGGCFIADTLVSTPSGKIPIQNLKVGDNVYSFDKHNSKVITDTVSYFHSHTPEEDTFGLYTITTKTNKVTVTGNHAFVTFNSEYDNDDAEWSSVALLNVGDKIYDENGITQLIVSIEKLDYKENTYNLEVENNQTYIADGLRVHNMPVHNVPDPRIPPKHELSRGGRVNKFAAGGSTFNSGFSRGGGGYCTWQQCAHGLTPSAQGWGNQNPQTKPTGPGCCSMQSEGACNGNPEGCMWSQQWGDGFTPYGSGYGGTNQGGCNGPNCPDIPCGTCFPIVEFEQCDACQWSTYGYEQWPCNEGPGYCDDGGGSDWHSACRAEYGNTYLCYIRNPSGANNWVESQCPIYADCNGSCFVDGNVMNSGGIWPHGCCGTADDDPTTPDPQVEEKCTDWLGDGLCDSGVDLGDYQCNNGSDINFWPNFNCEQWDYDGGDC